MSFVSWEYPLFLALVVLLYWQLTGRARILLILGASYFFYGVWDARFLALLLTSTAIDFFCGLAMVRQRAGLAKVIFISCLPIAWLTGYTMVMGSNGAVAIWILAAAAAFPVGFTLLYEILWRLPETRQRRAFLILSILTNLGVLGFFKYFNFFAQSALTLLGHLGWQPGWTLPHVILPVAISFYTFQSIAYSVDIYRGKAEPVRDVWTFAAYLSFFPQLVAGPIERPNDLVPQFVNPSPWRNENFHRGLRLLLIGFFKKIFVGDNCAILANYAFNPHTHLNGYWALLGIVAFAFQIYGDFSGYTDIARGSARLLGFHLNFNFRFPYFARNPSEFWQRWHITLSSWFRDYIYIPLGGNRGGTFATLRNLWITMLLAGLWHGASWMFVLWGAYHALLLSTYHLLPAWHRLAEPKEVGWKIPASMTLMFVLTLFGWVIFRCNDLAGMWTWISALGNWRTTDALNWVRPCYWLLAHVVPLLTLQAWTWKARDEVELEHRPWLARGAVYLLLFLLAASSTANDVEFIYFQF